MANPQHLEWLAEGVKAWNERRRTNKFSPTFIEADLSKGDFRKFDLIKADFGKSDLRGVDFRRAYLSRASFVKADLTGVDLREVGLRETDFTLANLLKADLRKVELILSNLSGATFIEADLRGADVRGTIFRDADLTGADFRGIIFDEKTDFTGAKLDGATFDDDIVIENGRMRYLEDENQPNDNSKNINQQSKPVSNINQLKEQIAEIPVQTVQANIQNNSFLIFLQTEMLLQHIEEYREKIRGDNYLGSEKPELKAHLLKFFDDFQLETTTIIQKISEQTTEQQAEEVKSWLSRAGEGFAEWWKTVPPMENTVSKNIPTVIWGGIATIMVLISGGAISGNSILNNLWAGCAGDILLVAAGIKEETLIDKIKKIRKTTK
jgi:uncharacterized protein YjbI with pentapeptide repeats